MAQYQNFSFEPPSRLEAAAQHADEKKGNCHHRPGSCSDSVLVATPADGVFGSDSYLALTKERGNLGIDADTTRRLLGKMARNLPACGEDVLLSWDHITQKVLDRESNLEAFRSVATALGYLTEWPRGYISFSSRRVFEFASAAWYEG